MGVLLRSKERERRERRGQTVLCGTQLPSILPLLSPPPPFSGCTEFHSGSKRIPSPPLSCSAGGKRRTFCAEERGKKEEKMGETEVGEEDPAASDANPFSPLLCRRGFPSKAIKCGRSVPPPPPPTLRQPNSASKTRRKKSNPALRRKRKEEGWTAPPLID